MSRLTVELKAGVFVGNINRRVREKLWEKIAGRWNANALMIYTTNNEQGYAALSNGDTSRRIIDYEGIVLTEFPLKQRNGESENESGVEGGKTSKTKRNKRIKNKEKGKIIDLREAFREVDPL